MSGSAMSTYASAEIEMQLPGDNASPFSSRCGSPLLRRVEVDSGFDGKDTTTLPSDILKEESGIPPFWTELLGVKTDSQGLHLPFELEADGDISTDDTCVGPPRAGGSVSSRNSLSDSTAERLPFEAFSDQGGSTSEATSSYNPHRSKRRRSEDEDAAGGNTFRRPKLDIPEHPAFLSNIEGMNALGLGSPFNSPPEANNNYSFFANSEQDGAVLSPIAVTTYANDTHLEPQSIVLKPENDQWTLPYPSDATFAMPEGVFPEETREDDRRKCNRCIRQKVECEFAPVYGDRRRTACYTCRKRKTKCVVADDEGGSAF